jgi:hypothetical protein
MPRRSKGARLWLEPDELDDTGRCVRRASWVIRDGSRKIRTGCAREDRARAEVALAKHIESKYQVSRSRGRHPSEVLVLDVLNIYLADKAPHHARPGDTKQRILTLADFWQSSTLADVNGQSCRAYVASRAGKPWKSSNLDATN